MDEDKEPSNRIIVAQANIIDEQTILKISLDLRSQNTYLYQSSLQRMLVSLLLVPNSSAVILQQDIIWILKSFIVAGAKPELRELSIAILRLIGVRNSFQNEIIHEQSIVNSLLQIIISSQEDLSLAGSSTLCNIINSDGIVRMALLQKRFFNLFIENLSFVEQMKSQSSSSSSSIQQEMPIFVSMGLLNVILKLVEVDAELDLVIPFISVVQQLRIRAQNEELKQKANQILVLFSNQHQKSKSNRPKTQNEQIAELEAKKVWLQQQLSIEREEQERLSVELIRICEQKEIHQREKERERSIRLSIQGEIRGIKDQQKREEELTRRNQLQKENENKQLDFGLVPFCINCPREIIKSDNGRTFTVNGYIEKFFSLDSVLSRGIYKFEMRINQGQNQKIGIIRHSTVVNSYIYFSNISGLMFFEQSGVVQCNGNRVVGNQTFHPGDIVEIELNLIGEQRTANLFINGKQQKVFASGLPNKVQVMFVLDQSKSSVTVLSLKRLHKSTVNNNTISIEAKWK